MKKVKYIVFRYITNAEFFNINKLPGAEAGGGGQSYIDFPIDSISNSSWVDFFSGVSDVKTESRAQGLGWNFQINSVGSKRSQRLLIYRRRPQSTSVTAQKIHSTRSNRVWAWHPSYGFPEQSDPNQRRALPGNLAVYIVKTEDGEFWAGYFMGFSPCKNTQTESFLRHMLSSSLVEGDAGMLEVKSGELLFDENDSRTPFVISDEEEGLKPKKVKPQKRDKEEIKTDKKSENEKKKKAKISKPKKKTEKEIIDELFNEDSIDLDGAPEEKRTIIQKVKKRNAKAVKALKDLYDGKCQISGEKYTFFKKDGTRYSEAHHLVPFGNDGADNVFNLIIVSPLIHKMLHHADVADFSLEDMCDDNILKVNINGQEYSIVYHPKHAELIRNVVKNGK